MQNIVMPKEKIAGFCHRYHISKLALFGSVLRADFRPDSEVDVLVEFEAGHVPGFSGWRAWSVNYQSCLVAGRPIYAPRKT